MDINSSKIDPVLTPADRQAIWRAIGKNMLPDDRNPEDIIKEDYQGNEDAYLRRLAGWHNVPIGEKSPVNLYDWGVEMAQSGEPQKALDFFSKATDIDPDFIDARYNKAVTLYALGRYDEAQAEYETVLTAHPNDVDALNNLGTIYADKGNLDRAKELFDRALAVDFGNALTHRNLAVYYKCIADPAKAADHIRQAIQLNPNIFYTEPSPPRINKPLTEI